ncbi:eukaryotic translation initiation factor 4 gamma 3 isoform X2 [Astyanax mexicanus]|uniref:eukaryotic translation initiation factor 4 gamma 3 isoform X2 n=1 Tax=Astyanax mexicanus TaxID=7994 RepID=UPI0020CB3C5B|nr:eukaryotic translation initiation factor 4 gamma 3 isoform X2 [Astyanax mexicanus]
MSLAPKGVPKPTGGVTVGGAVAGPPPAGQLRASLPPVPLPPGAQSAAQPPAAVPPPQIPRVPLSLEERIFPAQPGVTAVYSVPRHPGPPYPGHDLSKAHPNLGGAPPTLSQISTPAAPYRYIKGWETGGGPSYSQTQNASSTPIVYSPQTQPMNIQPPSRPASSPYLLPHLLSLHQFVTGPRPAHHQFLHRAQMQTTRPALPTNAPSIRASSQTPAAAVYPPNQTIMMTMTPMPFPSPQAAQYYIPQYRHSAPYVGPPQQYSVPPPGSGTFYSGPGPGEYPTPYAAAAAGPAYFPGQTVFPSSAPIIVPTVQQQQQQQQPPPAKREKKPSSQIRIRDPNQGGKDITEEIMSGSRNPTPPMGRTYSTPTPPQQRSASQTPEQISYSMDPPYRLSPVSTDIKPASEEKPRTDSGPRKASSPELRPSDSSTDRREASSLPLSDSSSSPSLLEPEISLSASPPSLPLPLPLPLPLSTCKPTAAGEPEEHLPAVPAVPALLAQTQTPDTEISPPEASPSPSASPSPPPKAVNGLSESPAPSPCGESDFQSQEILPAPLPNHLLSALSPVLLDPPQNEAQVLREHLLQTEGHQPSSALDSGSQPSSTSSSISVTPLAPPPGLSMVLLPTSSESDEINRSTDSNILLKNEAALQETHANVYPDAQSAQTNSRKMMPTAQAASVAPKGWKRPNEECVDVEPLHKEKEEAVSKDESSRDETSGQESRNGSAPAEEVQENLAVLEENGEPDPEPLRNGAGHASETESVDSGSTEDKKTSTGTPLIIQEESEPPNGKKQYDREFLLGFQFMPACVQKPEGLPPISDVVLDKINQTKVPLIRMVDPRLMIRGPDFTPAFADFTRQLPGMRGPPLLSLGARRPPPRKIIMNVSVNDDVQLKKAENAWKPGMKREAATEDQETQKTQDVLKKVRSILNKLTPQMFTSLMKQVTDLTINTEERLKGVIDLVFEKAIDEPSFSVAYANMCHCLATLKVPMADKPGTTVNFRKLLLNRCQKEFERDKMDDAAFEKKQKELDSASSVTEKERLQEELEEAKDKARRRSTGNIKFIGELFKLRMLTEPIMHDCVVKLLKNHDDESLECLCRLLTTIGKDLDFEKAKPRMDQYFHQMEKIVKERKTSSRIRFMLQDVIDLRLHNWVSRRAEQGPKTIEQIHKEAKIEEQEEQRKVHQQLLSKDKRRPEPRELRGSVREETWNTVPVTKNSRTIDPSKIPKISKPQMDDKIQLGPARAQLNWMKGSSGGAKASDSELSRSGNSSLNRYSALQSSAAQSPLPPTQNPEPDNRRPLASRGSSSRGEKVLSSVPSRPLGRGSSNKELLEAVAPEEPRRENTPPRKTSVSEERSDTQLSKPREPLKRESPVTVVPAKPAVSEEEMERKSKSIIDEFLHITDYKEAVQCVEELDQGSLAVFVRVCVESTLERSQISREHMGHLLYQLTQQSILPRTQLYTGFADTLEMADDMAIDIPHIWLYLAELLCPLLKEGGIPMRELFSELSKPLLPVGRAGVLLSEILHLLCKQVSHRKVGALWRESGLNWSDFLSEDEDLQSFISEQKLQFTQSDSSSSPSSPSKPSLPPEELHTQLENLLLVDMATDEQIFDWVEANLDESQISSSLFLRALMTAVCKAAVKDENTSCRVDTAIIQKRLPVLHKYFNADTERQLQALYALQALIVTLDQPPNLLRMFFDCLYDEDVISEDAFYRWETSKDPAEQQGKGIALKSVTAFFTWLREAEEESEDN